MSTISDKFTFGKWDEEKWLKENNVNSLSDLKSNSNLEKKYLEDYENYNRQQLATWDKNYKELFKKDYPPNQSPWRKPSMSFYFSNTTINPNEKTSKSSISNDTITNDWATQMSNLGYKKVKTTNGDTAYKSHDGTIYYNNGRMKKNNQMLDYNYMQLGQNTNPVVNTQAAVKTKSVTKTQPTSTRSKFNTTKFLQSELGQGEKYQFGNTEYVRYDPDGQGDFYIDPNTGAIYESKLFGTLGNEVQYNSNWQNDNPYAKAYRTLKQQLNGFYKHNGGKMNKINYFQQGGAAPQQNLQQQVIALVQAAMQGDQQATQQVNQIIEAAKSGDPQATQIAQMIQQVVQQMQGQATSAKWGAKLRYIKSLKYAKGGKTCPECEKKQEEKIAEKKCGGKAKKRYFGGIL